MVVVVLCYIGIKMTLNAQKVFGDQALPGPVGGAYSTP